MLHFPLVLLTNWIRISHKHYYNVRCSMREGCAAVFQCRGKAWCRWPFKDKKRFYNSNRENSTGSKEARKGTSTCIIKMVNSIRISASLLSTMTGINPGMLNRSVNVSPTIAFGIVLCLQSLGHWNSFSHLLNENNLS